MYKVGPTPTPARGQQPGVAAPSQATRPCTCLEDPSGVLGDAGCVTETADVLAEDSEVVLIAHNEIGHCAAGVAIVFINIEPLLGLGKQAHGGHAWVHTEGQGRRNRLSFRFRPLTFSMAQSPSLSLPL